MMDPRLCFVAMPFAPEFNNVYDAIEQVIRDYCGLNCVRADRIARPERITDDIHNYIKNSRFLIADLTGTNANVFYEVGMAKGREKKVILLVQDENGVPFDLKGIRYVTYDPANLASLRQRLVPFVRDCISTIPDTWDRHYRPSDWPGAFIKITSLAYPSVVELGNPFKITINARNTGDDANEGYFSVSFPDGVDDLEMDSSADTQIGRKGEQWGNDTVVLSYPIAEGFKWGSGRPVWPSGKEYFMSARGYAKRRGLFWFYINASSYDKKLNGRRWDPKRRLLDTDQRDENVYCGTIEVT